MPIASNQIGSKRDFVKLALLNVVSSPIVPICIVSMIATTVNAQTSNEVRAAINQFTRGAPARSGKVQLNIAALIDNGNTVPIEVAVDNPMTPNNFVQRLAIFSEKNPTSLMAEFTLSPANGVARVATRVRIATSQSIIAVAQLSDGSFWSAKADVIVVLSACLED